jgi:hypothetical protein
LACYGLGRYQAVPAVVPPPPEPEPAIAPTGVGYGHPVSLDNYLPGKPRVVWTGADELVMLALLEATEE